MENVKQDRVRKGINIVDIIIIIVVICALAFAAYKFLGIGRSAGSKSAAIQFVFVAEDSPKFVSPYTKSGDHVWDFSEDHLIGTVTAVKTDEAQTYVYDKDKNIVQAPKDGYESVYITVEANGVLNDFGAVIGNTQYAVGHTVIIYAGYGKYSAKLYSIEEIN